MICAKALINTHKPGSMFRLIFYFDILCKPIFGEIVSVDLIPISKYILVFNYCTCLYACIEHSDNCFTEYNEVALSNYVRL